MIKQNQKKPVSNRLTSVTLVVVTLMLIGCGSVGPDYTPPDLQPPNQWHAKLSENTATNAEAIESLTTWWHTLNDAVLNELIDNAVTGNLNVKLAQARVREARARRGISAADQYPTLTATGSAVKSGSAQTNGIGQETDMFSVGFDAGWEIDLFGGQRRTVEAAEADIQADLEALHQTLISLIAETALNYVDVRTYQTRLDVAKANLASQQESYLIVNSKFQAGLSNELAVQQARYNLATTRAQIPALETGLSQAKNRLAVLLGLPPGRLHDLLAQHGPIPVAPVTLAVGIPAETLQRRPDIRQYERQLAAQTARIGMAKADLYPKIKLTGSIGLEAISASDLFNAATRTWRIGPSISWPIFNAGAIGRNIEVQSVLQEQVLIQYESAVLGALEEVENAITAYVNEQLRRQTLLEAVEAARKAAVLAQDQYKAGLVDFSNVLDAQRSTRSNEDSLAQSEGRVTSNLISLYKALGGGWTTYAVQSPTTKKL